MSPNRVTVIPASPAHVGAIAGRMREMDRIECRAMGHTPKQALRSGLIASTHAYTATVDGKPEAMFGLVVTNALCGQGAPWMLGSEAIYAHPRAMMRGAPIVLADFFDSTRHLSNVVAVQNTRAIRFLRRLGFEIRKEVILFAGVEFHPFDAERK
jgi:ribosomal protein S18 acetylase RimI-like enzyme